ncbi:unnamed protein product [Somion occarium]|uniref:Nucleoside diphosphate kinase n=1 Tax=Somion occarium TaxID=3059160 RepID=A0ABP1E1P4_9APHY
MSAPASPVHEETPLEVQQEVHEEAHEEVLEFHDSPAANAKRTRTVAIIKTHALEHRFDIEPRISEAGFEIVKERQMEFDIETDPETMYELFGDDYVSFGEGPVWVYVLERRRAVEVWHTLMGHPDPEVARQETPHSLRALYGISREQNGLMGSSDAQAAEIQKPPEKPTRRTSSVNGISGSVGVAAAAAAKNTNTFEGVPGHKRRESIAVASTKPPTVAPRLNKSASLRVQKEAAAPPSSFMFRGPSQGPSRSSSRNSMNGPPPTTTTTRPSVSRPASAQSIGNTASTSRPNVLRTMSSNTTTTTTKSSTSPPNSSSDAPAVPAKAKSRRSSIQAPSIAPRQNKSAMLRAAKMAATNAAAAAAVTNGKTPVLKKVNRVAAAPRVAQAA